MYRNLPGYIEIVHAEQQSFLLQQEVAIILATIKITSIRR